MSETDYFEPAQRSRQVRHLLLVFQVTAMICITILTANTAALLFSGKPVYHNSVRIKPNEPLSQPESCYDLKTSRDSDKEPADKSYVDSFILPHLAEMNIRKLDDAVGSIPKEQELIIFVERLGLYDRLDGEQGRKIYNLRAATYSRGALNTHLNSHPAPKKKPTHKIITARGKKK